MTSNQFDQQEAQLLAELDRIQAERLAADERRRQEQVDKLASVEEEAEAYQAQALAAPTDDEKRKLYKFAYDKELEAQEIRRELGLTTSTTVENPATEEREKRVTILNRKTAEMVRRAILFGVAYFISDYASGLVDAGFFSFVLRSFGRITYIVGGVYFGCSLAWSVLKLYLKGYIIDGLQSDFRAATPNTRLIVLTILLALIVSTVLLMLPHVD